jgi:hypothetical protein
MERFHFAATILQTIWRRYFAKLNFELDMLEIIIVESAMRRYLARQKVARRRLAIQTIQNSARRTLAIRSVQRLQLLCLQQEAHVNASISIQVGTDRSTVVQFVPSCSCLVCYFSRLLFDVSSPRKVGDVRWQPAFVRKRGGARKY